MTSPKIALITRIRNESAIIADSLDHWAEFANNGIYIYDDCSTDNTVEICRNHPSKPIVQEGKVWAKDRDYANWHNRQQALNLMRKHAPDTEWIVCMDADERIEFPWDKLCCFKGFKCRLFDFYITPEDADKDYKSRQWMGPEYRDILFIFRNTRYVRYHLPSQREATLGPGLVKTMGYVKHYGKSISVEEWEKTCNYYANNVFSAQPLMRRKWLNRKGKAVKTDYMSDFKHPLIRWEDRATKGIKLTPEIHKREFE